MIKVVIKDTVREQMKRTEPRNPPRMVSHSVDPSCLLNICMPANTSTDSRLERTKEVPVFTATMGGKEKLMSLSNTCIDYRNPNGQNPPFAFPEKLYNATFAFGASVSFLRLNVCYVQLNATSVFDHSPFLQRFTLNHINTTAYKTPNKYNPVCTPYAFLLLFYSKRASKYMSQISWRLA